MSSRAIQVQSLVPMGSERNVGDRTSVCSGCSISRLPPTSTHAVAAPVAAVCVAGNPRFCTERGSQNWLYSRLESVAAPRTVQLSVAAQVASTSTPDRSPTPVLMNVRAITNGPAYMVPFGSNEPSFQSPSQLSVKGLIILSHSMTYTAAANCRRFSSAFALTPTSKLVNDSSSKVRNVVSSKATAPAAAAAESELMRNCSTKGRLTPAGLVPLEIWA